MSGGQYEFRVGVGRGAIEQAIEKAEAMPLMTAPCAR
jgi:hypothetical protein